MPRVRALRFSGDAHANRLEKMSRVIQLRNVPEALHRELKARAVLCGLPLSDYLIREVRKIAQRPTPGELRARLRTRAPYKGRLSPTAVVRRHRGLR